MTQMPQTSEHLLQRHCLSTPLLTPASGNATNAKSGSAPIGPDRTSLDHLQPREEMPQMQQIIEFAYI